VGGWKLMTVTKNKQTEENSEMIGLETLCFVLYDPASSTLLAEISTWLYIYKYSTT
jgi:hypothetical protein